MLIVWNRYYRMASDLEKFSGLDRGETYKVVRLRENITRIQKRVDFVLEIKEDHHGKKCIVCDQKNKEIALLMIENQGDIEEKEASVLIKNEIIAEAKKQIEEIKKALYIMTEKAEKDSLTQVWNRLKLFSVGQQIEQRIEKDPRYNLSVALIDLDNFKIVNQVYGHAGGDEILQLFTQSVLTVISNDKNDKKKLIFRYGGEEFILISRVGEQELEKIIEKIQEEFTKKTEERYKEKITFSAGISGSRISDSEDSKQRNIGLLSWIIKRADTAMYVIKNNGKNGISIAE